MKILFPENSNLMYYKTSEEMTSVNTIVYNYLVKQPQNSDFHNLNWTNSKPYFEIQIL